MTPAPSVQTLYPSTYHHVTLVLVFAALCEYYIFLTARLDKGQGDTAKAVDNVNLKGLGGLLFAGPKHLLKVN